MKRSRRHMLWVLLAVYRAWRRAPEQRLCQMLANATHRADSFFVEDEEVHGYCEEYAR